MARITKLPTLIFSAFLVIALASGAKAADWKVVKTFGQTWVQTSGIQKISLSRGTSLSGNATVITGRNGKVFLVRGNESIIVAPNSMLRLRNQTSGGRTTILQDSGSATYRVHRRNAPHFTVKTPTLSALVKGTNFKVVENRFVSKVWVNEGLVQVTVPATGEVADIRPGQSAVFEHKRNASLNIVGPGARDRVTKSAAVETLGGAAETGGGTVSGVTGGFGSAVGGISRSLGDTVDGNVSAVGGAGGGSMGGAAGSLGGRVGGAVGSVGGAQGDVDLNEGGGGGFR